MRKEVRTGAQVCPKIIRAMHVSTLANCLFIRQLAGPVSQCSPAPWKPAHPLSTVVGLYLHKTGDARAKTNTNRDTRTQIRRIGVCVCVSINISLAHSPSETPKFCNIYKVAKKRRISPPKPNRIESKRSESGQPSRADRLTEPQKCTQRKKTGEDWVYKKYVYLKSEVF